MVRKVKLATRRVKITTVFLPVRDTSSPRTCKYRASGQAINPDDPPITYPDAKSGRSHYPSQGEDQFHGPLAQPAEKKIQERLKKPTQIEFVETPLKDVIDYLKDLHHIEIRSIPRP